MAMYTLLRNAPQPTKKQIDNAIQGKLSLETNVKSEMQAICAVALAIVQFCKRSIRLPQAAVMVAVVEQREESAARNRL